MAWYPPATNALVQSYNGTLLLQVIQSLSRELERMQKEIDELRKKVNEK
jgi:hypothetical protein